MGVVGMRFLLCGAVALARFVVGAMSSVLCLSGVPPRTETGTGSEPGNCRAGSEIQLGFHDGVLLGVGGDASRIFDPVVKAELESAHVQDPILRGGAVVGKVE